MTLLFLVFNLYLMGIFNDYILVDKRFRKGVLNCKARPGADCASDHNPE